MQRGLGHITATFTKPVASFPPRRVNFCHHSLSYRVPSRAHIVSISVNFSANITPSSLLLAQNHEGRLSSRRRSRCRGVPQVIPHDRGNATKQCTACVRRRPLSTKMIRLLTVRGRGSRRGFVPDNLPVLFGSTGGSWAAIRQPQPQKTARSCECSDQSEKPATQHIVMYVNKKTESVSCRCADAARQIPFHRSRTGSLWQFRRIAILPRVPRAPVKPTDNHGNGAYHHFAATAS